MSGITFEVQLDNAFVILDGQKAQLWTGEGGLPVYVGSLDKMQEKHPEIIKVLLERGFIKPR
jgi:hypothetical protein